MTNPQTLPKRHEVPTALTWDLTVVYADEAAWDADFARIEGLLTPFDAWQNTLTKDAPTLLVGLSARDELWTSYGKLYTWSSLRLSEDNGNSQSQARADRTRMLGTRMAAATAYIEPQILAMSGETLRAWLSSEPGLQLYSYYFETLERRRPHVRSAEVEDVLAQVAEPMGSTSSVFRMFSNADIKFPPVTDENGVERELTHGNYISFLENRDAGVRERAFRTMHGAYREWRNTMAASLTGAIKSHVAAARVRHYGSALEAALQPDAIPTSVYTNLISTARERLPVLHRYLRLRKQMLGLSQLHMWDLYVPMVGEVESAPTWDESKHMMLRAFVPLGENYVDVTRRGFEERWVDVVENEGKTSGAFSDGSYLTPPYVLMNWRDNLDKTFTLAHELGHSLHSYHTRQGQPAIYGDYTIFVAEVASTLNEALLTHLLINEARAQGDTAMELYLLNNAAEGFRTTLYRQTMFAEFELKVHEVIEQGEGLSADRLTEIYWQLNKDYYGAEVDVDETVAIEWARIPHFYYDFYVYQYATGLSAATALAQQVLQEGPPAVERYLKFLSGGSSQTSIALLQGAGVDMETPAPIHAALDAFDQTVARMEELAAALKS